MRALYATLRPPFPPKLGDQLIAWEQIKRLADTVDLHLLMFGEGIEDEGLLRQQLAPFCRDLRILPAGRDRRRIARSFSRGTPYLVELFNDPRLYPAVQEHLNVVRPDVVHVQSIHITEYFRRCAVPKVLDLVDVLSRNMARRVAAAPWSRRWLYRREARLLHRYEATVLNEFAQALLVSSADAAEHPTHRFCVNPNGTRISAAEVARHGSQAKEDALIFHGNMSYAPNIDAARFLCRHLMPRLRVKYPSLKLHLVGFDPPPAVRALHDGEHVVVSGSVADIVPHIMKCTIGVYPLRLGSGMPNKIIDALSCGLPCVVSPMAVEGIAAARDGQHLRVATDTARWVATIEELLADPAQRARLGADGQAMVRGTYTWDANVARVAETWRLAMTNNR